jgi:cytochrome c553
MKSAVALLLATFVASFSAGSGLAAENQPAAKPDLAKGQASAATCVACHTADGTRGAPANPILAGQHPEYLAKQLHEFKSGKRKNAIMQGMAAILSDDDIRNVAAYYASTEAKPGAAKNKTSVLQGEKIWRAGIADRRIAACAGCHGPNGAGIPAQFAKLSGQHADYTAAQLLAFRSGLRANSVQMTGVAAKMNDAEIKAVADYVAGLR